MPPASSNAVPHAIGIDLGGTRVKAVLCDADGVVIDRWIADLEEESQEPFPKRVRDLIVKIESEHGPAEQLGLAAPGLASKDNTRIDFMPGRLEGLEGLDWTDYLNRPEPVPVLNDAHAALLGEAWQGAAKGLTDVFMLTLGTGVGGAILSEGRLLKGTIGRAGHLGHLCLDPNGFADVTGIPGSLEEAIGECSLHRRTNGRYLSTRALVEARRSGDEVANRIWLESIRALACGIASLVNVLDSEAVVLGGGISNAGADLFEPLEQELNRVEWRPGNHRVQVLPAQLGEFAGALGAARAAS